MNENKLKEYARLICEVGVNIQKGQDVRINVSIEHHKLAELIVEKAYEMGARKAVVKWNDDVINRLNLINQSIETLSEVNNELEGMYKADLERKHVIYKICEEKVQPDGFIVVKVKRQYNSYDCSDYIN